MPAKLASVMTGLVLRWMPVPQVLEHELHDTQARLKAAEAEIAHLRALIEMAKRPAEGP